MRLRDLIFLDSLLWGHNGPIGIEVAREILVVFDCPLVGALVKPKLDLDLAKKASMSLQRCGPDLVKDTRLWPIKASAS